MCGVFVAEVSEREGANYSLGGGACGSHCLGTAGAVSQCEGALGGSVWLLFAGSSGTSATDEGRFGPARPMRPMCAMHEGSSGEELRVLRASRRCGMKEEVLFFLSSSRRRGRLQLTWHGWSLAVVHNLWRCRGGLEFYPNRGLGGSFGCVSGSSWQRLRFPRHLQAPIRCTSHMHFSALGHGPSFHCASSTVWLASLVCFIPRSLSVHFSGFLFFSGVTNSLVVLGLTVSSLSYRHRHGQYS